MDFSKNNCCIFFFIWESDTVCFRTSVKGWLAIAVETLSTLSHRSVLTQFGQVKKKSYAGFNILSAGLAKDVRLSQPDFVCCLLKALRVLVPEKNSFTKQ